MKTVRRYGGGGRIAFEITRENEMKSVSGQTPFNYKVTKYLSKNVIQLENIRIAEVVF